MTRQSTFHFLQLISFHQFLLAFTPTLPVRFDFTSFAFRISSLMFDSFTFLLTFTGWIITPSSFGASFSRSSRETFKLIFQSVQSIYVINQVRDLIWFKILSQLLSQLHLQLQYKDHHLSHHHSRQGFSYLSRNNLS